MLGITQAPVAPARDGGASSRNTLTRVATMEVFKHRGRRLTRALPRWVLRVQHRASGSTAGLSNPSITGTWAGPRRLAAERGGSRLQQNFCRGLKPLPKQRWLNPKAAACPRSADPREHRGARAARLPSLPPSFPSRDRAEPSSPPAPPLPAPALTARPAGRSSGRAESSEKPLRAQYLLENIIMAGCMGPAGRGQRRALSLARGASFYPPPPTPAETRHGATQRRLTGTGGRRAPTASAHRSPRGRAQPEPPGDPLRSRHPVGSRCGEAPQGSGFGSSPLKPRGWGTERGSRRSAGPAGPAVALIV